MWPWIKRWRDWAMHELWPLSRIGLQPQALHYSFEKAGLTLHDQPVPWNAEVVLVEALVRLPANARNKAEFQLRIAGQDPIVAESLNQQTSEDRARLFFRFPPPARTISTELFWRNQLKGQLTIPMLSRDEFLQHLRIQMPTMFVRLQDQNVACQTFVSSQCKGLMASALITSPTSLVPLLDLGLHVEFRSERIDGLRIVDAQLCSSQLADRHALVAVVPRHLPRKIGSWTASWMVGDRLLATQRVKAISQRAFQKSLRVSSTRFVVQKSHDSVSLVRQAPPLEKLERMGPCFLVSSREPGMAGLCPLQVRAQVVGSARPFELPEQEILITDGPTAVAPGTFDVADMHQVTAFELLLNGRIVEMLPLAPVPAAAFNSEGGFKAPPNFAWSPAADDELNSRLTRLIEGVDPE